MFPLIQSDQHTIPSLRYCNEVHGSTSIVDIRFQEYRTLYYENCWSDRDTANCIPNWVCRCEYIQMVSRELLFNVFLVYKNECLTEC